MRHVKFDSINITNEFLTNKPKDIGTGGGFDMVKNRLKKKDRI